MNEVPPILSMTEDKIKEKAQPLTDTDLSDKQNGTFNVKKKHFLIKKKNP